MTEYSVSNLDSLTNLIVSFSVNDKLMEQFSVKEATLVESLLTPGLQTSIKFHAFLHTDFIRDYDQFKGADVRILIEKPALRDFGFPRSSLDITQIVYRIQNRKLLNNQTEELTIQACDPTTLEDAKILVSDDFGGPRTPSEVVRKVFSEKLRIPASRYFIEESQPVRDYIAENIHPFQVVAQNSSVALASGNDPSFVHFMTYEDGGKHHFRSLKSMANQSPFGLFQYTETGTVAGYANPFSILTYSFPCDFDLLSDILNGVNENGSMLTSVIAIDALSKNIGLLGNQSVATGLGAGQLRTVQTNVNTAEQRDSKPMGIENYALLRQARMSLLEQDKIALRMTVPWNPLLNAGKTIAVKFLNKELLEPNYGSGVYLISSLIHNIKSGGFSTTTLDCVAQTVGGGKV